jgi:hypothetical protein
MKTYKGILSVVVVLAMVSSSALVATAQGPDQGQGQAQQQVQSLNQGPNQGPSYDHNQAAPQNQNQSEDQNQAMPPGANDPPQQGSPQNDPPAVAARLQFVTGSVSVQPHGADAWVAGVINRPLTNSDNVWADKNSRAEINVGSALIRIDSESSLTLTNISDKAIQLQLHQGAMNLHVRSLEDGETYEVDTQNQAFTVQQPGDYRFDVNPDADTTVITVWQGQGQSTGNGPAVLVHENEQARFSNGTSLKVEMHAAPGTDAFDDWAQSRDERFDHSVSAQYVSPDVVGSQDLDEYGQWKDSPEYGNVWVPSSVDVGWAPYRNGHWISVAPWGWTWVEDEPWGYAPFHYGRWVYFNNYWGWAPGPIYGRPYYSPALVAFYGGRGWGVGLGFGFGGGFGWCPLGFGEPFVPWYGVSRGYFNRVNITNTHITNINNVYNNTYVNRGGLHGGEPLHYANMRAPNGFTAVSRDTMVNSRSVARNNVRVSPSEFNRLSPTRTLDVQPTRNTMLGANAGRPAVVPPSRTVARPVYGNGNSNGTSVRGGSDVMSNRGGAYSPRPNGSAPNSVGPNSNVRMPDRSAGSPRFVPRPPNAGSPEGRTNQGGSSPRSDVYEGGRQPAAQSSYSRPSPSNGGGSYSRPAPTYDRGSDRGSYGGGRASGGGGRPSGGSGGRASAPSHSSGGGGGSSHSGGGPRGRH